MANEAGSAGHRLGQLVGDWWERYVVLPLLQKVADELKLFLDNRFVDRPVRNSGKIIWKDDEGNEVDYDFVLELDGSASKRGTPVAFFEVFWRRGARHSKDKARDDSGKLVPMRDTYPTARFLSIAASGEFTEPAKGLVVSRDIELFHVPKSNIIEAFDYHGLVMDYPDSSSEDLKAQIARTFEEQLTEERKREVANTLFEIIGQASVDAYISKVRGFLAASPLEVRFIETRYSNAAAFKSIEGATNFLESPSFNYSGHSVDYIRGHL
jgi:hypothetical protein